MNTITLISLIIAAVVIVSANAIPTPQKLSHGESYLLVQEPEDGIQDDSEEFAIEEEGRGNRFRRATCDLLSISLPWGSLNHSACAAHCIAMRKGFKGGRCRDGVCHCRR